MMSPEKWRDTVDPFSLPYQTFTLKSVLGYPHAGNDVFYVEGVYAGKTVRAYVKAARQPGADTEREASVLRRLHGFPTPAVLDAGEGFCVTAAMEGERLSVIVGENACRQSLAYMDEYGEMLARLHEVEGDFPPVRHRRFFDVPEQAYFERYDLRFAADFLHGNRPQATVRCFCHGDFHYANVLWQNGHISGVLDFELCGIGDRDFDIAWAIIRRPGQRFMNTQAETDRFLSGYARRGSCDVQRVRYYMALIYAHFYAIGRNDAEYAAYVRQWLWDNAR